MSLKEYQHKRKFRITPEPRGKVGSRHRVSKFVVQKHDASHLHYDFRLEMDGVLKSWAVPKGPSLDPGDKRLAVEVEDHPLEYGTFEGTIPDGQYGAGTVMLWDNGTWEPSGDPHEGYAAGKLKFQLHGKKLSGGFSLVRMRKPAEKKPMWLLMKERDEAARRTDDEDVLAVAPLSVKTGRTLEQIQQGLRRSQKTVSRPESKSAVRSSRRADAPQKKTHHGRSLPTRITPELATLSQSAPEGDDWLHEIKFDGYRLICRIHGSEVQLLTRNHLDWTSRFPTLASALETLPIKENAILDGEVVVLDEQGVSSFQRLQNAFKHRDAEKFDLFLFDLLYLEGRDLQSVPLEQRKQLLQELLGGADDRHLHYSDHVVGDGPVFFKECERRGLEGMISKRLGSLYSQSRTTDWLKTKCIHEDEFVIGGYTKPSGERSGFGALLLGNYDHEGNLVYVGKVGTGFTDVTLQDLTSQLKGLHRKTSPFANDVDPADRHSHFVRPALIAQVKFASWTADRRLRQASFLGLREDKDVKAVIGDKIADGRKKGSTMNELPTTSTAVLEVSQKDWKRLEKELEHVKLTHPDRVFYPNSGLTKVQLAAFYVEAADRMLPHVIGRPLSLLRCPDGVDGTHFFQKHAGTAPSALRRVPIPEENGTQDYLVVENLAGLIALAQIGALEIHPWGSRADNIERPDRIIFDFDPDQTVPWAKVIAASTEVRDRLAKLGLESFVKATGGKGLHVVVPIQRRHPWMEIKQFAKSIAESMAQDSPDSFTTNIRKSARAGKIFIDILRNSQGATAIAPYSTRANQSATVATPLAWDELSTEVHSDSFDVATVARRLQTLRRDPWDGFFDLKQSLKKSSLR